MTERERQIMMNLADTIKGEINRMCVTDELSELDTMSMHAAMNLKKLHTMRYEADFKHISGKDECPVTQEEIDKCLDVLRGDDNADSD